MATTIAAGVQADNTPVKPEAAMPGKTEGVNIKAAIAAFKDAKKAEKLEDAPPPMPTEAAAGDGIEATNTLEAAMGEPPTAPEAADKPGAASTTVEIPEEQSLKVKLRAKLAARQRAVDEREAKLAAQDAAFRQRQQQFDAQAAEIKARTERFSRLETLAKTDPRAFMRETGIDLSDAVTAELAEIDPAARAKQMGTMIQNLPKLIEEQVKARLDTIMAERTKQADETRQRADQAQRVAASEKAFADRALKAAEERPATARLTSRDPRASISMAYVVQETFHREHGRIPTELELDANVEAWLSDDGSGKPAAAASSAQAKTKNGKVSPRANGREGSEKPLSAMSDEERLDAARRQFMLDNAENDSGLRSR